MDLSDKQLLKELVDSSLSAKNLQRRALAKLITLLESTLSAHQIRADEVLNQIIPLTGKSFRLGISGVPGVGKSTLIEALGLYLIAQGHRVAVLAIDPSSTVSGGSILGDKTRMEQLSMSENAFIRPSPTAGNLGGVAEKTRETILLAEAAGFDVVIVETVGVGQSEIAVANMTDMFVLMHLPNAGDDLQAIKKGVMELADLVLINKADIDQAAATRAQSMIAHSLHLIGSFPSQGDMTSKWQPQVLALSALKQEGIAQFWDLVKQFIAGQTKTGAFLGRRQKQASAWLTEHIEAGLKLKFREHTVIANQYPNTLEQVRSGQLAPSVAARHLLAIFHSNSEKVG